MDSQRNFFLILFIVSLGLLWLNWTGYQHRKNTPQASPNTRLAEPSGDQVQIPTANPTMTSGASALPTNPNAVAVTSPNNANSAIGEALIEVDTPLVSALISSTGGNLVKLTLKKHQADDNKGAFVLFNERGVYQYSARSGLLAGEQKIPNHVSRFNFDQTHYRLEAGVKELVVRAVAVEGDIKVTKSWVFAADRYEITLRQTIENQGAQAINVSPYYLLTHNNHPSESNSFAYSTFQGPAYYTTERKFNKVVWADINKSPEKFRFTDNNGWSAIVQHYFVGAWVLPQSTQREYFMHAETTPNLYSAGQVGQGQTINSGSSGEVSALLYAGPQDQAQLSKIAEGLELVVDYGLLTVISKPLFSLMLWIHSHVGNWGWTIVLLTLIIKAVFFPLSAASYKSMARMKKLTPKLMQLREQYAHDKQKQQMELIKLYQTEKVNPLGGCLPIFIQIPVFIALYWVLLGSVEMRSAPWIGWITDLAKPDPFFILPTIYAASMFIQTKLNPPPPDPMQAKMMMIMPLVFSVFFFFFPSGLVLYWVVNNIISIAQQQYSNRKYAHL